MDALKSNIASIVGGDGTGDRAPTGLEGLDSVTLTRFVLHGQKSHTEAKGDLTMLLAAVQLACKVTETCVRRAGIANLYGLAGSGNVQGEDQKKLDIIANDTFKVNIQSSGKCCVMVSEEEDLAILCDRTYNTGKYAIAFDPLDGSSNIDANVSIGSIFAIYKISDPAAITTPQEAAKEILQPGRKMVCAGYAMYGSATNLVISMGEGVHGFTLDPSLGEFVLTDPNMRIPSRGKIYSVNEGNARMWDPATTEYIKGLKYPEDPDKKAYALRYIGSMVADIHRTLLVRWGGVAYAVWSTLCRLSLSAVVCCVSVCWAMQQQRAVACMLFPSLSCQWLVNAVFLCGCDRLLCCSAVVPLLSHLCSPSFSMAVSSSTPLTPRAPTASCACCTRRRRWPSSSTTPAASPRRARRTFWMWCLRASTSAFPCTWAPQRTWRTLRLSTPRSTTQSKLSPCPYWLLIFCDTVSLFAAVAGRRGVCCRACATVRSLIFLFLFQACLLSMGPGSLVVPVACRAVRTRVFF